MDSPVEGKYPFGDLGGSALGTARQGRNHHSARPPAVSTRPFLRPSSLMVLFGYTRMDSFVGIPNVDKNVGLDIWKIPRHQRRQAVCERHSIRRRAESYRFRFH
jgi:hypothetical protein